MTPCISSSFSRITQTISMKTLLGTVLLDATLRMKGCLVEVLLWRGIYWVSNKDDYHKYYEPWFILKQILKVISRPVHVFTCRQCVEMHVVGRPLRSEAAAESRAVSIHWRRCRREPRWRLSPNRSSALSLRPGVTGRRMLFKYGGSFAIEVCKLDKYIRYFRGVSFYTYISLLM